MDLAANITRHDGVFDEPAPSREEQTQIDAEASDAALEARWDDVVREAVTISRAEYEVLKRHDYAGPGTPLDPSADGFWFMRGEHGGTVLYVGVKTSD